MSENEMAEPVSAEEDHRDWVNEAAQILMKKPFSWEETEARSYAVVLAKIYLSEGLDPEGAIEEDQQYWD